MNQQRNSSNQIILNVNTFQDQNDGGTVGGLSLRDAILQANADVTTNYIINLPAGTYNLTLKNVLQPPIVDDTTVDLDTLVESRLNTGDLDITGNVTIIGPDPAQTIIDASGLLNEEQDSQGRRLGDRLFDVSAGGNLTLENVTIQNGIVLEDIEIQIPDPDTVPTPGEPFPTITITVPGNTDTIANGGAINVEAGGTAILNNSIVADSESGLQGGGINNAGIMELNDSIVRGHQSGDNAGGIYNTGTLIVNRSTLSDNFAQSGAVDIIEGGGGAILNETGATLTVVNSTISGNSSGFDGGGGILSRGQTTIINSTIVNNQAQIGAGIWGETTNGQTVLFNSIVAQNTGSPDLDGFFNNTSSNNLVGAGTGGVLNGINNNIVGDSNNPIDPLLGPLQNNGGTTPTHALLPDSPALDVGNNVATNLRNFFTSPPTDQRGLPRISNGIVDLGAYELQVAGNSINSDTSSNTTDSSEDSGIGNNIDIPDVSEVNSDDNLANTSPSLLETPIYRLQNTNVVGTYLYVGEQERQNIRANNPEFVEEGLAFKVGIAPGDGLIAIYRFQNMDIPGTYLYAGEEESISISQNNPNFVREGIAFYVYGADANQGEDIYRFQNSQLLGTYIFVGGQERENIRQNFTHFIEEGPAFEVNI
jgi:hypothetical protein